MRRVLFQRKRRYVYTVILGFRGLSSQDARCKIRRCCTRCINVADFTRMIYGDRRRTSRISSFSAVKILYFVVRSRSYDRLYNRLYRFSAKNTICKYFCRAVVTILVHSSRNGEPKLSPLKTVIVTCSFARRNTYGPFY